MDDGPTGPQESKGSYTLVHCLPDRHCKGYESTMDLVNSVLPFQEGMEPEKLQRVSGNLVFSSLWKLPTLNRIATCSFAQAGLDGE